MKEFLNPEQGYSLVSCCVGKTPIPESWIEVPEGAIKAYLNNSKTINFVNKDDDYINSAVGKWCDTHRGMHEKSGHVLVWQRGEESLNDKIATAEAARQNQPNQKTIDAMREAEGILSGKHSHYKKDVSHLNVIDPYRIADLYDLHPCADHIMKKSLCAGNRGHKDKLRDIQDIIDTAERWKQMIGEDNNEL